MDVFPLKEIDLPALEIDKAPMEAVKRTYQPHKMKRQRKFGYLSRLSTPGGRKILQRRKNKGRAQLAA